MQGALFVCKLDFAHPIQLRDICRYPFFMQCASLSTRTYFNSISVSRICSEREAMKEKKLFDW
jgi:hypothetical protein